MLLGVIKEAGDLESGASSFPATLEAVALTSDFSVGKQQEGVVYVPLLLFSFDSSHQEVNI